MENYYIAIAILIVIIVLMYSMCLSSSKTFEKSKSNVDVTYYFNPGCPHCRNFTPVWKDFSSGGGANFTEINCATNPGMCGNVRGVPWVVFSKKGLSPVPYTGNRDKSSLKEFLNAMN